MFQWLFGKSWDPETDIPDLSGKVILVTGGNTGLGKESVLQLVKHNAKEVFLAARTPSKAEEAIKDIKQAVPNANITYLKLDLSSFKSIAAAADEFNAKSKRLDILLNNAGVMAQPYSKSEDGYEIQFGTNHMGHALLTKLLLPTLLRTAEESNSDVRIVNLSSDGHSLAYFSSGIIYDQDEAEKQSTISRYGAAKLANILHASALAKRYPQLTATAVHPGVIDTQLGDNFKREWGLFASVFGVFGRLFLFSTVPQGAMNQLWACTAPKQEVKRSHYFTPVGKPNKGSAKARDVKLEEELEKYTEAELQKHGY